MMMINSLTNIFFCLSFQNVCSIVQTVKVDDKVWDDWIKQKNASKLFKLHLLKKDREETHIFVLRSLNKYLILRSQIKIINGYCYSLPVINMYQHVQV